mmetsp:Transcript_32562/g.94307  ORF Transcript_32562/g.94307 Transcript_32562/m.94307 type:complete len:86 (-) Transcript_32562:248-505(-)
MCSQDPLGAPVYADDFVVSGSSAPSLMGICQSRFRPKMGPDELCRTVAECLTAALERDCLTGSGIVVYVIDSSGMTIYSADGPAD